MKFVAFNSYAKISDNQKLDVAASCAHVMQETGGKVKYYKKRVIEKIMTYTLSVDDSKYHTFPNITAYLKSLVFCEILRRS